TQLQQNINQQISGLADLTAIPFDPYEANPVANSFVAGLRSNLKTAKTYVSNLKKVKKLGLSSSLIASLASSSDGESIIATLAQGSKSNIAEVNNLVNQIGHLGKTASISVTNDVY